MKILLYSFVTKEFLYKTDNTLIKSSREFFIPVTVTALSVTPALVFRIDKSAKYVSAKFAHRYYSQMAVGLNLYPVNLIPLATDYKGNGYLPGSVAFTMDNTSFISEEMCPVKALFNRESGIELIFRTGSEIREFSAKDLPRKEELNSIIESSTINTTLKSGDLIYLELCAPVSVSAGDYVALDHISGSPVELFIR
ncbi:MAG: hypothetical protein PHP30_04710 [Bacteroidales bacterium]|nr:hypothetical protein [Bacteroidales bacterium]MDD2425320.1 hypothetical protein [Bacteroidales bacterium]MDD3989382.1 hypothetical protein [Bacteroidales bacterium]MDD4639333.1 hypothetical protein [Bacteroidales bacterium]